MLVVIGYDDDDDAVRIANNSIYGLSGAVFGGQDRALAVARRIRTGTFSINGGNYFSPDARSADTSSRGIGREMGNGRAGGVPGDARRSRRSMSRLREERSSVMTKPLEGIRVLEVAMYGFVPSAGRRAGRVGRGRHQGRARGHRRSAARAAADRPAASSRVTRTRTSSTPTASSAASGWTCRCPRARRCCSSWPGAPTCS